EEEQQFNTAVARMMELLNSLSSFHPEDERERRLFREGVDVLLACLNPFCPHMTEELWELIGHSTPLAKLPWPKADPAALEKDSVTIAVQINGKVREKALLSAGLSKEELEKEILSLPQVVRRLEGLEVLRVISVPDRLVNVVVKG
ncbi:MAG: class I tRNA ligase family protein, partial [Synergistaceae bacterium]|nr:class I tRNA ligase family protein [Synergistaceae bacterium]